MQRSESSFVARNAYWLFIGLVVVVLGESRLTQPAADRPFYLAIAAIIGVVHVLLFWLRSEATGLTVPETFYGVAWRNNPFRDQPEAFQAALAVSRAILLVLGALPIALPYLL